METIFYVFFRSIKAIILILDKMIENNIDIVKSEANNDSLNVKLKLNSIK